MKQNKSNHAGDMNIYLGGSKGGSHGHSHGGCGCGCNPCCCPPHEEGSHTHITKRVSNVMYGDELPREEEAMPDCGCEPEECPDDPCDNHVTGFDLEGQTLVLSMQDGTQFQLDVSSLIPVFDATTITGSGTTDDPYTAVVTDPVSVVTNETIVGIGTDADPFRVVGFDLPRGVQDFDISVVGTERTNFSSAVTDRSARLEAAFANPDPTRHYYELLQAPQAKTLTVADYPGLATAGQDLELMFQSMIGYYMNLADMSTQILAPYQYGVALLVDGVLVQRTRDLYAMDKSGHNSFVSSLQRAVIQTTGNNIVIEMIPFVEADSSSPLYNSADEIGVDTTEGMIHYEVVI